MKVIIFNNDKALIMDVENFRPSSSDRTLIQYPELNIFMSVPTDKIIYIDADMDVVKVIAESLVGEDGEITCYNLKEKSVSVKKVGNSSSRGNLAKKLINK